MLQQAQTGVEAARFQVFLPGQEGVNDVLGLWEGAGGASEGVIWRAELPEDSLAAGQALAARGQILRRARLALSTAPSRLAYDLPRMVGGAAGPAFDLENTSVDGPNDVLRRAALYRTGAVSFDTADGADIDDIGGVVERFTAQVRGLVGQVALVESISRGSRRALSQVAWSGEVDTWFAPSGGRALVSEHQALLAQSLATRQAWMHFLLMFSTCVVRVLAELAVPKFPLLTVWTTWKYLQKLVEEYKQLV